MRSQRRIVPGLSVLFLLASSAISVLPGAEPHRLDLTGAKLAAGESGFKMGTSRAADGRTLTVDGWSLLRDGRRWLPVMGEIHYARYPEREWRDELLKMKAGGIDIVATYVFWIHHEEIEGQFDWSGQRNLRRFVQTCAEIGLPVVVRTGPWCHGEVRNGGLPDWLLRKGFKVRSDEPGYLEKVRVLYGEIAAQVRGLLWKDGGPVVGIQLENEYGGLADHLLTLKRLAREAGLDVPLYTRTGWPNLRTPIPFGEILPLFGAYAEGFWDRELTPMPGKYWQAFTFELRRADAAIATDQLGERAAQDGSETARYPYLTCELGGGMMCSYHRRIRIAPEDIVAVALTKIGSGSNLPGYYMYHGGTNPEGRLSTLQELQATPITNWNDLPVKTYDFQAPLGEFGQVRAHYHLLRRLHLFLRDFGEALTTMPAAVPAVRPVNQEDAGTLRWSARSDGRSGFVFVNNYQRLLPMPAKADVQFELKTDDGIVRLPENPCTVPADASFFWPFNLNLDGARLIYATAQPVCRVEEGGTAYVVFTQTKSVPTEFVFAAAGLKVESANGHVASGGDRIRIQDVRPGTGAAIRLQAPTGRRLCLIVLDEAASLACWKDRWHGQERIFLTRAAMLIDGENVRLQSEDPSELSVAMLPAPEVLKVDGVRVAGQTDGVFRRFSAPRSPTKPVPVRLEPMQSAGPARAISLGGQKVAEAPGDADFAAAAVWRVKFPEGLDPARDLLLRLHYTGDAARLYLGDRLLTDNFYNGNVFDLGLRRFAPEVYQQELLLKILPLRKDASILLPADAGPKFGDAESAVVLARAEVIETCSVAMSAE